MLGYLGDAMRELEAIYESLTAHARSSSECIEREHIAPVRDPPLTQSSSRNSMPLRSSSGRPDSLRCITTLLKNSGFSCDRHP